MNMQEKCKAVRKFIRENPDSNSTQIKDGAGFPVSSVLSWLLKNKVITFTAKMNEEGHRPHLFRETPDRVEDL